MIKPFLFFVALLSLAACNNYQPKKYISKDGGYEVTFKGEPVISHEEQKTEIGTFKWTTAKMEGSTGDKNIYYSISYCDIPNRRLTSDSLDLLEDFFALTQKDFLLRFGQSAATQLNYISLNGYPGRQTYWVDNAHDKGYKRGIYLVNDRIYKVETSYLLSNLHNASASTFEKSFRLLNKRQNPNPEPKLQSPEKRFEINFPEPSTIQSLQTMTIFGKGIMRLEMSQADKERGDRFRNIWYAVICIEVTDEQLKNANIPKVDFLKMNLHQNSLVLSGGKVISETESEIEGIPCLNAVIHTSNGELAHQSKSFLYQGYLYQIAVISTKGFENNAGTYAFMNSFKFVKDSAN